MHHRLILSRERVAVRLPQDLSSAAILVEDAGGNKQPIGQAIEINQRFGIERAMTVQGYQPAFRPAADGASQMTQRIGFAATG